MLQNITDAVYKGNLYDIQEILKESLDAGTPPQELLEAMLDGLEICGDRFEEGRYFLPELMMAGETFKAGMQVLEPELSGTPRSYEGTVVLGTVQGDVHDIGKNLVGFMLESAGFKTIDLGVNVPAERFASAISEYEPDCLGMSALLTTTMLEMESVIQELENEGLREKVKVILGGAPVSKRFAESIGADSYASDAASGVHKIRELISGE
ncbi:MAG: cobalamin-binding protein [Anaerolineales bacterium]|nr:cobalamin-binding protein [Anaerolineales bacterium]